MCGIFGIIDGQRGTVDRDYLKRMTDTLAHRGPDGEGYHVHRNVGLGHRRLSIIDLRLGSQPMGNEDGTVWISYNGEIYNFPELKKDLEARGHRFRTHSDTEVIVHGYEEWGSEVGHRLRGMLAFAILDQNAGKLFLARDRVGIKPLVYYTGKGLFLFASEIKAILRDPRVERKKEPSAVAYFFECGYVPAPGTIYRNIHKLAPGSGMTVSLTEPDTALHGRYWDLGNFYEQGSIPMTERDASERVRELLAEAVRIRLVSDVPLGALLSGGIDSSSVVALMCEVAPDRIDTFSIGFNEERYSEVEFSRLVAGKSNTRHHERFVTPMIRDLLPRLVYHFDEPFADSSAIPTYYVCKTARENVTVCLSGDGGDEIFAGYDRYVRCSRMGILDILPGEVRRTIFGGISRASPAGWKGGGILRGIGQTPDERFLDLMKKQYGYIAPARLFDPGFMKSLGGTRDGTPRFLKNSINDRIHDPLTRHLHLDLRTYLPNDILAKVDITSMMNSLEVRVPFLDHKFLEFAARIPPGFKLHHGERKYILKKAVEGRLPGEVLRREKKGFGVPIREWLAGDLREITRGYLLYRRRGSGVLNHEVLEEIVLDNERQPYSNPTGGKLWWFLFFEMWFRDVFRRTAD